MGMDIDAAAKRGRGYLFVDGLAEMAAGVVFVLLGGVLLLGGLIPEESLLAQIAATGVGVVIVKGIGLLAAVLAIWWLKDRFTYPRTGYVRQKRIPFSQILAFVRNAFLVLALPLFALAAAFVFVPHMRGALSSIPIWAPALLGVVWGVPCYWLGEWAGLRRFRLLGMSTFFAGIAVGVGLLLIGWPGRFASASPAQTLGRTFAGVGLLSMICGAAFVLSGLVTFLRYRKENPLPYGQEP
jgi:hypothetical protein